MIATRADVCEFERMARSADKGSEFRKGLYLLRNYCFFLTSGFDEVKVVPDKLRTYAELLKIQKDMFEDLVHPSLTFDNSCFNSIFHQALRLRFRESKTGLWYQFLNVGSGSRNCFPRGHCYFFIEDGNHEGKGFLEINFDDILENSRHITPSPRATALHLPNLLLPTDQKSISLNNDNFKSLICQIHNDTDPFAKLSWRDLEEVVAELLKSRGMEVTVTKQTRDGGRDIIARGELIPGEPMLMAVEVKHKKVVGINDLREALYANRNYPSLLIATSGRFSAGIIKEGAAENNAFRVLLKDGVGLKQWLHSWWSTL